MTPVAGMGHMNDQGTTSHPRYVQNLNVNHWNDDSVQCVKEVCDAQQPPLYRSFASSVHDDPRDTKTVTISRLWLLASISILQSTQSVSSGWAKYVLMDGASLAECSKAKSRSSFKL